MKSEGKTKLFGGMKIKGPALKPEEKQHISHSQTTLSFQNRSSNFNQKQQQSNANVIADDLTPKNQLKHANQSIQETSNQEYPKLHKKQSKKHQSNKLSTLNQNQNESKLSNKGNDSNTSNSHKKQTKQLSGLKPEKKSRSETDFKQQIEQSDDKDSIKEDRSVIVGASRQEQEKDELQFRKRKPSGSGPVKSNPFLNQIKKTTAVLKNKQQVEQKRKQTQISSSKGPAPSLQPQQKSRKQKDLIMSQIASSHIKLLQNLLKKKQAKQLISTFLDKLVQLSTSITQIKDQLSVLTNKQNQYISAEEYQEADKLQSKIQQFTAKIEETEVEMNFTQEQFYKIQYESLAVRKNHFDEERRIVRRLKLVELDLEDDMAQFKRGQQTRIENQKVLNQNQKKKISRIVNDIKSQSEQLQKYEKTFYEDLNSRRKPLQQLLKQDETKRTDLEQQIKQLQQKLKKKKNLLKSTLTSIQSTKQKIQQVDTTFQSEKHKLQERKDHLNRLQDQKKQLNSKLKQMQEEIIKLQRNKTAQLQKMETQRQSVKKISARLEKFLASIDIEDYLQAKRVKIDNFISNSKSLQAFQEKHKQKKQAIKQLQFKKSNILSEITKKQEAIKQLKSRVPKLQTEQKQMSMAKNFKGAGMKKNQIKQCTDEIVQIKKQIEASYAQQAEIEAKIQEIASQQEQFIEQQNQIRKNLAISQYNLALQKREQLMTQMEWLKDLQKSKEMKLKYQPLLKQQLDSLNQEISYIKEEYGLSEGRKCKVGSDKQVQKVSQKSAKYKQFVQQSQELQIPEYAPLALNEQTGNDEGQNYKNPDPERQHLDNNDQEGQNHKQNLQQSYNPDKQSVYEPPALLIGQKQPGNSQQQQNHQTWEGQNHEHLQDQQQQSLQQQETPDDGYMPLQLD